MAWQDDLKAGIGGLTIELAALEQRVTMAEVSAAAGVVALAALEQRVTYLETFAPPPGPVGNILWQTDGSSLAPWYLPGPLGAPNQSPPNAGGGEFDSGDYQPAKTVTFAGKPCAELRINTATRDSGVRLFRWLEPRLQPELYYSAWFYFPVAHSSRWWQVWQWKSKSPSALGGTDPFFFLAMRNRLSGMHFRLEWWNGLVIEGPQQGQSGHRTWDAPIDVPVGQWVHVEARYVSAGDFTGHLTIWQDGQQIFDLPNVRTRYADGDTQWSVNNYGSGLSPNPCTIYVAECAISTRRIADSV